MDIHGRRQFCKKLLAMGACISVMPVLSGCELVAKQQRFASAYTARDGQNFVAWFNNDGEILGQVAIAERAHDLCYVPNRGLILAFSRRPGRALNIVDMKEQKLLKRIESSADQHFFGHGVLSHNGKWLYTTENRFDDSYAEHDGLIVVRNTDNFAIAAQFSSFGVGPHQLAMLQNSDTLVVANGGIHTHPASPRTKLNLDSMKPNLSYIDTSTGQLLEQVTPPDHQLSMRHLCVANDNTVYVGCQYQGPKHQIQPLIFAHTKGGKLQALQADQAQWLRFKQYTASLAVDSSDHTLAVTSPRGGIVSYWHRQSLELAHIERKDDCAGIAADDAQSFVTSTGKGYLNHRGKAAKHDLHWDNHMINCNI
jgi:hypothetical protein